MFYVYHIFTTHLSVYGHLQQCHILSIISSADISMSLKVSLCMQIKNTLNIQAGIMGHMIVLFYLVLYTDFYNLYKDFSLLLMTHMDVSMFVYALMFYMPCEVRRSLRARIISIYKPFNFGPMKEIWALCKSCMHSQLMSHLSSAYLNFIFRILPIDFYKCCTGHFPTGNVIRTVFSHTISICCDYFFYF